MSRILLKKLLLPLLGAGLLIGLWFVLGNPDRAPQVSFTTIEGKQIALSGLKGRMVLVNFWATSCPGCITEMPKLVESYKQYQANGFDVVAVAMAYDPPNQVVNYAKKNGLPFPVAFDTDGALANAFNVQVTPTSIVIDQQGKIVQRIIGEIDFTALHTLLDEKLGRKAS